VIIRGAVAGSGYSKYDSSVSTETERESAMTRDWGEAEVKAREWLDQFDPDKVRIKQFEEAEKRRKEAEAQKTVIIEEAIGRFLGSLILDRREESTLNAFRGAFGYVDHTTYEVRLPGRLLKWIETQTPRPKFISDLTLGLIESFRLSWKLGDRTAAAEFRRLKQFFKYCVAHKWMDENPLAHSKSPEVKRGNRTGAFSDEECLKIEDTAQAAVDNAKDLEERQEAERLLAFLELLRWSGMALHDAVTFSPNNEPRCYVDSDGVLTYVRRKTKKYNRTAIIQLPPTVVELLHNVPPGRATKEQPFLERSRSGQPMTIHSVKHLWWSRLRSLYKAAGIGRINTDVGTLKNPGAHIWRDTFAVGMICSGIDNAVEITAKCLGDTIKMVEEHCSPQIKKMKSWHAEKSNQAMKARWAQLETLKNKKPAPVLQMGGRRG
jgi:integrase